MKPRLPDVTALMGSLTLSDASKPGGSSITSWTRPSPAPVPERCAFKHRSVMRALALAGIGRVEWAECFDTSVCPHRMHEAGFTTGECLKREKGQQVGALGRRRRGLWLGGAALLAREGLWMATRLPAEPTVLTTAAELPAPTGPAQTDG